MNMKEYTLSYFKVKSYRSAVFTNQLKPEVRKADAGGLEHGTRNHSVCLLMLVYKSNTVKSGIKNEKLSATGGR